MGRASNRKKQPKPGTPDQCPLCRGAHHPLELPPTATDRPGWGHLATAWMQDCMWHIVAGVYGLHRANGVTEEEATAAVLDPSPDGVANAATFLAAGMFEAGRVEGHEAGIRYGAENAISAFWSALAEVGGPGRYVVEVGQGGRTVGAPRRMN